MIAGLVRLRQRIRVLGSSLQAFGSLLEEFERSEQSSQRFPLMPKTIQVQRIAREIEVSMPDQAWAIFDGISPLLKEFAPAMHPEIVKGAFVYFGLWWLKELLITSENHVTAMKLLLQEIAASGEII